MKSPRRHVSSEAPISFRQGVVQDAVAISRVAYQSIRIPEERSSTECARILGEQFAFSVVAERSVPAAPAEIIGVLNAVLIKPWFAKKLLESEAPFCHNHIRGADSSPFPTTEDVAQLNGENGLDLLITHFSHADAFPAGQVVWLRGELVSAFVKWFSGNRLRSLILESIGITNTSQALDGGFEVVTTYDKWRRAHVVPEGAGPTLMRLASAKAIGMHNYQLSKLLQYKIPILRFPYSDQEVLRLAVRGLSDARIKEVLGVNSRTVSSRWGRIYKIINAVFPELIPSGPGTLKTDKRASVLEYLRSNPEELWPYLDPLRAVRK